MAKDFLTDEEMSRLDKPDFISDEDMELLDSAAAPSGPSFDMMKAGKGLLAGDAKMLDEGLGDWVPDVMVDASKGTQKGLSLGHDDEIRAAVQHPVGAAKKAVNYATSREVFDPKSDDVRSYIEAKMAAQRDSAASQKRSPIAFGAGEFAGALAPTAAATMAVGPVAGPAIAGAAMTEGNSNSDQLSDDALDIAKTGAISGVVGGLGKVVSGAGGAVRNAIEDVATTPSLQAGGAVARTLGKVESAGKKLNSALDYPLSRIAEGAKLSTGNAALDNVASKVIQRGARYAVPGLGKVQAAADAMEFAPKLAKGAAFFTAETIEKMGPRLGKFGPVLKAAAARGNDALATTTFLLQQTDPEFQEFLKEE